MSDQLDVESANNLLQKAREREGGSETLVENPKLPPQSLHPSIPKALNLKKNPKPLDPKTP